MNTHQSTLAEPKTSAAHILYELIMRPYGLTERDLYYNGFRQRISELRKIVSITSIPVQFTNTFGHKGVFSHYRLATPIKDAKIIYENLNK